MTAISCALRTSWWKARHKYKLADFCEYAFRARCFRRIMSRLGCDDPDEEIYSASDEAWSEREDDGHVQVPIQRERAQVEVNIFSRPKRVKHSPIRRVDRPPSVRSIARAPRVTETGPIQNFAPEALMPLPDLEPPPTFAPGKVGSN